MDEAHIAQMRSQLTQTPSCPIYCLTSLGLRAHGIWEYSSQEALV